MLKRANYLVLGLVVGVVLCGSNSVLAQPIFGHADSIELTVARAGIVVVGKIVEVGEELPNGEGGERLVTITVEETLKGKHRGRQTVRTRLGSPHLTSWQDEGTRLLVAARGGRQNQTSFIDLTPKTVAVLTADATLLRKPEEVIRIARETTLRLPGIGWMDAFTFQPPRESYAGTHWATYHGITLSIPVDERLQRQAVKWIESNHYGQKENGATALRYFKTDENIKRATALLDDTSWSYLKHPQENNGITVRYDGVRKAAHQTLKHWGVKAKQPLIREEIRPPR